MRWVVLWDTACNFNVLISNQSIFNSHNWGNYSIVLFIGRVLFWQLAIQDKLPILKAAFINNGYF